MRVLEVRSAVLVLDCQHRLLIDSVSTISINGYLYFVSFFHSLFHLNHPSNRKFLDFWWDEKEEKKKKSLKNIVFKIDLKNFSLPHVNQKTYLIFLHSLIFIVCVTEIFLDYFTNSPTTLVILKLMITVNKRTFMKDGEGGFECIQMQKRNSELSTFEVYWNCIREYSN